MRIYYWLFKRANRSNCALWLWRKWSGVLILRKHLRRGNWKLAKIWMQWLITP